MPPNRCEPSIEALNFGGGGGHGRCEQRSEVFVKIQKKKNMFFFFFFFFVFFFWGGGRVWGVRMDVNEELNFL